MNAPHETVIDTDFQPTLVARDERPGKKINCPVAVAAVSIPTTSPRFATNQRLAIVAAKTSAIEPVPIPTTTPHKPIKCQGFVIKIVEKAPMPTVVSAVITTLRIPKRSIKAAANGAVRPNSRIFIATASEISSRDQLKASSSGTTKTEGADLKPAVATNVKNVTAAANQAG